MIKTLKEYKERLHYFNMSYDEVQISTKEIEEFEQVFYELVLVAELEDRIPNGLEDSLLKEAKSMINKDNLYGPR